MDINLNLSEGEKSLLRERLELVEAMESYSDRDDLTREEANGIEAWGERIEEIERQLDIIDSQRSK